MRSHNIDLTDKLHRVMARAGIVEGYQHKCRARVNAEGKRDPRAACCTHIEVAPDKTPRHCPVPPSPPSSPAPPAVSPTASATVR